MENGEQPAYPLVAGDQTNVDDRVICEGLSKREYFAIKALQGLLSNPALGEADPFKGAVQMADELLKALSNKKP